MILVNSRRNKFDSCCDNKSRRETIKTFLSFEIFNIRILASLRDYQNSYAESVDGFHTITVPPPPPAALGGAAGAENQGIEVPIENGKSNSG